MKVAIFLRDLGLGGVERCAVLVGEGLAALGFEVTLVLLGGSRNLWQSRIKLVKVVDLSGQWQPLKPWTWLSGWRAARNIVREHDVVIAGTFLLPLYMAYAASMGLGKRVIGWVHGPFFELDAFARMNRVHRAACQFVYRRLKELVFVSNHARNSMARWLEMPPRDTWAVLPNFVDEQQVTPQLVEREMGLALRLLFVGRIAEEKQPHLWLDTLVALNIKGVSAQLTIVGDGPLEAELKKQVQERGLLAQVEFAGRRDNVGDYLAQADVLLLTSNFEGCPLVVLEAMPMGVLIASTNAGGVYELFGERRSDFVVEAATAEALASLIVTQQAQRMKLQNFLIKRADQYSQAHSLQQWSALLRPPSVSQNA
ncbi:glycosyltransferase [Chitinibacter bivalviorum]|uniref:Glycosyltransferase n=1 Tax=Chitinibacter bivalviorum TaxID=2739434 RepID=A0A7H9BKE5_9NEIS|nr:glycosyltransferase [Chitinibacter bivalviorum]QLG88796.1 glycosyltransferase [Chitinibacter bivalviorum]